MDKTDDSACSSTVYVIRSTCYMCAFAFDKGHCTVDGYRNRKLWATVLYTNVTTSQIRNDARTPK